MKAHCDFSEARVFWVLPIVREPASQDDLEDADVEFDSESLDYQFDENGVDDLQLRPSEYFQRQIYGSYWFEDDIEPLLELYRDIAELAPLAIEPEWDQLVTAYETAATVVPGDEVRDAGERNDA